MDGEFRWLADVQEQVLSWRQARSLLTPDVVKGRIRAGLWQRPCRGVVVAHNGPLTAAQREWAAVIAAGPGALLAGTTAAGLCGLRRHDSDVIHVLLPSARVVRNAVFGALPVLRHRTGSVHPRDALPRGRPPHTTIARSLIDAAQWAASDDGARTIVAAAFQQRLVGLDEITATLERMPRARRRRLVLETAIDASGGAHSRAELDLLRICRRYGLPEPSQQQLRRDRHGRRRWLDAYWARRRLHVEVDGGHHTDVREWWADMHRQNALWVAGDRVLRFPAWALRHTPETVATQLHTALTAPLLPDLESPGGK